MQRKILKISLVIFIGVLLGLSVVVKATNEPSIEDLIVSENTITTAAANDAVLEENDTNLADATNENEENNETDADEESEEENPVANTASSASYAQPTSTYVPQTTTQQPQTFSTVATIPEANLSLNNILNVILIAVGVIIILLAIAILIRIK